MRATDRQQFESALGEPPLSSAPLSGGCVGEVYKVTTASRGALVVKVDASADPRLDIEGYMLRYLREHSPLPVPAVRASTPSMLVMDFVEGRSGFDADTQVHAAELLVALHDITQDRCGFERDTLIGGLPQSNAMNDDWIGFFAEQRLLDMGRQAVSAGRMGTDTLSRLERFCGKLQDFLVPPEKPALLHGDIWSGNVLAGGGRVTAFIDPAIYYGHPEIELAFITLFGTFGARFFDAYQEQRPIASGFFEERKDIYNLFPLLVHVTLFGGSYLASVENTLSRFE